MAGAGRRGTVASQSAGQGDDEQGGGGEQSLTLTPAEVATLDSMIINAMPDIASIVPAHVNPAQYQAIILGMLHKDLKLAYAAMNNSPSFMAALADCARLGLTPGDGYAFMTFRSKGAPGGYAITGTTEYTGELQLIEQTGLVRGVVCQVVFPNDDYEPGEYAEDRPSFRKHGRGADDAERGGYPDKDLGWALPSVNYGGGQSRDPGRLRGQLVFAYAVFHDGTTSPPVEMSRQEIMNHRAVSRNQDAWDGPFWRSWWMKTAIHELYKWIQKSTTWLQRQDSGRAALAASPLGLLPMAAPVTSLSGAQEQRAIGNGDPGPEPGGEDAPPADPARDHDMAAIVAHFDQLRIRNADRQRYVTGILGADDHLIAAGNLSAEQAARVAGTLDAAWADAGGDAAAARDILDRLTNPDPDAAP